MGKTYRGDDKEYFKEYDKWIKDNRKAKTFDYSTFTDPPLKRKRPKKKYVPHSETNIE